MRTEKTTNDKDTQEWRQQNPASPLDDVEAVDTGHVPDPEEASETGAAEGKTGVEGYRR